MNTRTRSMAEQEPLHVAAWLEALHRRRREWLVVVLLPLAIAWAMYALDEASLLRALRDWLTMAAAEDSWHPMQRALERMHQPDARTYLDLFFQAGVKFQYPPTSLLLHELAARVGHPLTPQALNLANWVLVWVHAGLCAWFGWRTAAVLRLRGGVEQRAVLALLAGCAGLLSYPVLKAYVLGQAQLWLDVAFVAACLAWLGNRKLACGVLVGAICLVKPQFSLFLPWALLRGEWRFVAGWAAVVGTGLSLSLATFGWQNHLDYLQVLRALSATGESYYPNQSVNGILNRLLGTFSATVWYPDRFPPFHPVVHAGTVLTSAVLVAGALLYRCRQAPQMLDFQGAALAFTMASPIAWEHHYGILTPIFITLYGALAARGSRPRPRSVLVLGACYLLAFGHLGALHVADAGVGTLAHAYRYLAVAVLLVLLVRTAGRPPARSSVPRDSARRASK